MIEVQEEKKEKLKKAQIMITKEIKRICEANNINYFLDAGSMLGAVRHKGFIPWDDDIDIGMLKEDYERFIQIAPKQLNNMFFLDNYELDSNYGLVFSKVKLKNTIYKEKLGSETSEHQEIFVDIFAYFYRPENKFLRFIQTNSMRILGQVFMAQSGFKLWKSSNNKIKYIPILMISKLFSRKQIYKKIDKLYNKCKNSNIVGVHDGYSYKYWNYNISYLKEFIDVKFENETFRIPRNYHEILSKVYGDDYMKLPPIEKRRNHEILELDLGPYDGEV